MIKIIFLILILFHSISHSKVNWIKITKNKNGDTFYIDKDRIQKDKTFRDFWVLIDSPINAISERSGVKSIASEVRCNCVSFKYKTKKTFFYSDTMGKGRKSNSSNFYATNFSSKGFWTFPSKDSSEEKVITYICK